MAHLAEVTGARAPGLGGLRASADGSAPGRGEPGREAVRRPGDRDRRACPEVVPRLAAAAAAALPEFADRPGPRPSRSGHRRRAARAPPGRGGLLADPVTGDGVPAGAWRDRCTRRHGLLASESGHFEAESGEHDLHAFQAVRRMDEVLVNNFMVFSDLVERESFDLWVGDEAWDLDYFLHENPELKRAPFVWMTDFVGWVPMPDGGEREADAHGRLERRDGRARGPLPDAARSVGLRRRPGDVVDLPLGPGLPSARDWTEQHFDFAGLRHGRPRRLPIGRQLVTASGTRPTRSSAWSAWAAPGSAGTCCSGSRRRTRRPERRFPACGWWR